MLKRFPRLVLAMLLFINVVAYIDRSLLLAFSPQMTKDLGLSNTQFGFLSGAVWVLSYGVMALFCGTLADRFSRTRIIAGGLLIWSACTAASGFAQNFEQMVMARLLVAAGEAALVPSATALLADLFDGRHRSTANGLFFMGLPLGIGFAYLLSGTVGASIGWRGTFMALGVIGIATALLVVFVKDEGGATEQDHGEAFVPQLRALLAQLRQQPAIVLVIAAFIIVHLAFAQSSFVQLWLVRERGADSASIAQQIGLLQIFFGCLGAAGGGIAADRLARGSRAGLARFPALSLAVCLPLMIASRFAAHDSALIPVGLAASFFLPFSVYGSSLSLIQGSVPHRMRATVIGLTMMCLNFVAIALGSFLIGIASDRLGAAGHPAPLTSVLLATDVVLISAIALYVLAARKLTSPRTQDPVSAA